VIDQLIVPLKDRSYPIVIGNGNLPEIGRELGAIGFPSRVALVGNTTVFALYGAEVENFLTKSGFQVTPVCLPDGENIKPRIPFIQYTMFLSGKSLTGVQVLLHSVVGWWEI